MTSHDPTLTLGEAKAWLRQRVREGAHCPCCGQFAKVYKRKLTATQVRTLAEVGRRQAQREAVGVPAWIHLPDIPQRSRDFATVAYFRLAEEERVRRPDGGRSGWWKVTPLGYEFLEGVATVPRYAKVYNGGCIGFEGDHVSLAEIAPGFSFAELMAA